MFGGSNSKKAEALYQEQNSRNDTYSHDFEYRSFMQHEIDKFDLKLNAQASAGWELVGFHVAGGEGNAPCFYATLRRPRNR